MASAMMVPFLLVALLVASGAASVAARTDLTFAQRKAVALGGMNFFFGNLHSHSMYSDGSGYPESGFEWARDTAGFDFYAVTDHAEQVTGEEWADTGNWADRCNEDGRFTAIRGFEWTSGSYGHINVLNTADFTNARACPGLEALYRWIRDNGGYGQFNHPAGSAGTFDEFRYMSDAHASNMCLVETGNAGAANTTEFFLPYYIKALDQGWRLAPAANQDNHSLNTNRYRTAVVAPSLTRGNVLGAIANRRVYSTDDPNMQMLFKYGDNWMGSSVVRTSGSARLDVMVEDDEEIAKLQLFTNGGTVVAETEFPRGNASKKVAWRPVVDVSPEHRYFFVRVVERDTNNDDDSERGYQYAVSAPIFFGGGAQDVSMKVEAGHDIVAERPMYFDYQSGWRGGTTETGVVKPWRTWYLAEGTTRTGFDEWICIQNPGESSADVRMTYMFPGGRTALQTVTVAPHSRFTIDVNNAVGPGQDVSARVESNEPVVVERPMYFDSGYGVGGSIGTGVTGLSKTWYLAEGSTRTGFQEWLTLMNPMGKTTTVDITYMFRGGATQKQTIRMAPTSRETVNVNTIVGPDRDVSAKISASNPIIAERPMYFLYHGNWSGGDTQVGATSPGTDWLLAEGSTRYDAGDGFFEEWISVQNPGGSSARVSLTYMFPGGGIQRGSLTVPAHARETISVNNAVGNGRDVSVRLTSTSPVVVERPMYFDYHGTHDGGSVDLGCRKARSTWYFAEGTIRRGFEQWVTLQNPDPAPTTATITFMFENGATEKRTVPLPGYSRTTVFVPAALDS